MTADRVTVNNTQTDIVFLTDTLTDTVVAQVHIYIYIPVNPDL